MPSSDIPNYMWWHRCSFVPLRPVNAEFELSLTAVGAKPSGRDVQGQSVCQRRPGSQVKHAVRVVPPASFLVSVPVMSRIRARPPSCSVRVCSSGGVKPEGHRGAVIYAHPRHGAHRAAAQSHRATWPVVPEVGRGWHRAVICWDTGKSTPGPPRRTLFAPHPKVSAKNGWGCHGKGVTDRPAALLEPPSKQATKTSAKIRGCQVWLKQLCLADATAHFPGRIMDLKSQ